MLFLLIIYFVIIFYGSHFTLKPYDDYLSIEKTTSIKGVFIIMVFFSHFNSYIPLSSKVDEIYLSFFYLIGQAMVALFMFYSGYGVMESIRKKGADIYISSIPKKRIISTLLRFDIAVLLFIIIDIILKIKFNIKQVLLSFIGWESVGNSNWYIFIILLLYFITYISFKITSRRSNYSYPLVFVAIFIFLVIIVMRYFDLKPVYWYDTMLCYPLGMLYSMRRSKIETLFYSNIFVWAISILVFIFLFIKLRGMGFIFDTTANLVFSLGIVILSTHVSLNNKLLNFFGSYLFEIYILQRIPMIVYKYFMIDEISIMLYFFLCILSTTLIAYGFRFITNKSFSL